MSESGQRLRLRARERRISVVGRASFSGSPEETVGRLGYSLGWPLSCGLCRLSREWARTSRRLDTLRFPIFWFDRQPTRSRCISRSLCRAEMRAMAFAFLRLLARAPNAIHFPNCCTSQHAAVPRPLRRAFFASGSAARAPVTRPSHLARFTRGGQWRPACPAFPASGAPHGSPFLEDEPSRRIPATRPGCRRSSLCHLLE